MSIGGIKAVLAGDVYSNSNCKKKMYSIMGVTSRVSTPHYRATHRIELEK